MFCLSCAHKLPKSARFCQSCGAAASTQQSLTAVQDGHDDSSQEGVRSIPPLSELKPTANLEFRQKLLDCYFDVSTSKELSEWLRDLGQDPSGTAEEKIVKIRQQTKYLSMPAETFPDQTIQYLRWLSSGDGLFLIAESLGLNCEGSKDVLFRKIYREVGFQEGWLPRVTNRAAALTKETVLPFVQWYPILKNREYEKDYYEDFYTEMAQVFGKDKVHEQYAIAHGKTLKVDFHIGHPQQGGVGIEFKMPNSQGDIQRAQGQLEDYQMRYGRNLIVVLLPNFMTETEVGMFTDTVRGKGVTTVVKTKVL